MELPIACTLTEAQMRERGDLILRSIRQLTSNVETLVDGYAFEFPCNPEVLRQITQLVDLECQCCPFLTFKIVVPAESVSIRLEVTGPPEAKSLIAQFFRQ